MKRVRNPLSYYSCDRTCASYVSGNTSIHLSELLENRFKLRSRDPASGITEDELHPIIGDIASDDHFAAVGEFDCISNDI